MVMKLGPWILVLLAAFPAAGCDLIYDRLGGNFQGEPGEPLSGGASRLIEAAFDGLDPDQAVDHHFHVVGLGKGIADLCKDGEFSEAEIHLDTMRFSWFHPVWKVATSVLLSASGITDTDKANEQYARRMLDLVRHYPGQGKFHLLALDGYYEKDGTLNWDRTDVLVPNRYVLDLANCLNRKLGAERFVPVVSIHPYRRDAIEKLKEFNEMGVRYVKWLPNSMNIDPADSATIGAFYGEMARRGMVLISHTGRESALRAFPETQGFGNPLRLIGALEMGVTVIMAHVGRDGGYMDPKNDENTLSSFDLFLHMMKIGKYRGRLFGGLSGLMIDDKVSLDYPVRIIGADYLSCRIVNGSDYPLPAVSFLNPTATLLGKGYITADEKRALDEIYGYNPLLFDLVTKRSLRHPETGKRLPAAMFRSIEDNIEMARRGCPD